VSRDIVPAHTALPQGHTKRISPSGRPTSQRFLEYYGLAQCIVKRRRRERVMWQAEERTEMHTGFLWEKRKERDNLEDLGVDVRVILKPVLKESLWRVWTGSIWYRIWAHVGFFSKTVKKNIKFQNIFV
jgi:hypothetical protein